MKKIISCLKKTNFFSLCILFILFSPSGAVLGEQEKPRFALTYNVFETASFIAINKLVIVKNEPDLIFLPFHFDGQLSLRDDFGLSFGFIYRFESYQDKGPLYSSNNAIRAKKIWTNHHEIFLLAGPRFSFLHSGINGFYFSMKGGLGFAFSPVYANISLLTQPEIGYAFSFGNPGFRLELGLGALACLPVLETVDFAVPWKKNTRTYGALGVIVHRAIPIVNVGIGASW